MAKATNSTTGTTSTTTPKAKRPARTLDERIAELQAKKDAQAAKSKGKAELEYNEVVGKYNRAVGQAMKFAGQLRDLAAKHGFALPDGIAPPTANEVEAAQVELANETAEASVED
jgi:hypothetical protein